MCFLHAFIVSASLAWAYMCFEYDWPICDCVGIGSGHHSFPTSYSFTWTRLWRKLWLILEKARCSCNSFIGISSLKKGRVIMHDWAILSMPLLLILSLSQWLVSSVVSVIRLLTILNSFYSFRFDFVDRIE